MTAVEMGSEDDPTEAKRLQEMRKGWSLPRDHALDLAATGWAGISRGTHITHPSELRRAFSPGDFADVVTIKVHRHSLLSISWLVLMR